MSPSLSQLTLVQNTKILSSVLQQNHSSRPLHQYNKESKKNCSKNCCIRQQNQSSKPASFLKINSRIRRYFKCTIVHGILHNCTQYFAQSYIGFRITKAHNNTKAQYFNFLWTNEYKCLALYSTMKGDNVDLVDANLMSTIQRNGFNKACCSTNQSKQQ